MAKLDQQKLVQVCYLVVILALGVLLFSESYFLLPGALGALTLYILLRQPYFYLIEKRKWKHSLSIMFLMFASFVVLLGPIYGILQMVYNKVSVLFSDTSQFVEGVKVLVRKVESYTNYDILNDQTMAKLQEAAPNWATSILGATANTFLALAVAYFLLYFLLKNGRDIEEYLVDRFPLRDRNVELIGTEIRAMVVSNAIGIPLLAAIQAVFASVGYWIFGVDDPILWGVVTGAASIIPAVGTILVWAPIGVFMLSTAETWQGVGVLLYSLLIISNVDNVVRLLLQKKLADVHPIITIFGVIIGINLFGFIGVIFGPLLFSLFILLLRIYQDEFGSRRSKPIHTASSKTEI